ncbi:MAG: hypothetical protein ABJE95_08770 [Byssovorax sp.]
MIGLQRTPGIVLAIGISVLGAVGCGGDASTASSSGSTTGAGGAAATTGSGGGSSSTDTSSASGSGGAAVMLADVDVTVNYAGTQTGTLSIAAVTSFPPMGPPVAFQSFKMPMFPQKGMLIGLEVPRDYYIVAVLDIGNNNPQSPGPEDLVAITMPAVKLTAGAAAKVDLTLTDKP